MSDASSKTAAAERVLPGWLVAVGALLATVFLFYFAQLVGGIVVNLYPLSTHMTDAQATTWLTNAVSAQFAYGLIADGLLVGGVSVALKWLGWNWGTIGFHRPKFFHLLLGAFAVVPYFLLYLMILFVAKAFFPSLDLNQKQDIGFNNVGGALPLVLTFVSLVVLPPLAEETVMRGFLYTGLKRWLPWGAAGLVVSTLFGAAHLAEGGDSGLLWVGAIDTYALSWVLVFLRETTGSLWPGIVLHAIKNGVAFVTLFIIGSR